METSVLRFLFRKHKRKKVSQMYTVCQHHLLHCIIAVFTLRGINGHNRFLDYIYLIVKKSSVSRQRNFLNFGTELLCCFIWWVICWPICSPSELSAPRMTCFFSGRLVMHAYMYVGFLSLIDLMRYKAIIQELDTLQDSMYTRCNYPFLPCTRYIYYFDWRDLCEKGHP